MDHAWLKSLSEDWVSQPRSSGSPAPSLPSLSNSTSDSSNAAGVTSSRIPKYDLHKQAWSAPQDENNSPLSERSINDNNIPLSQRASRQPSKLRGEITDSFRGRRLSRTVSASTIQSTQVHNTIQHKSVSLSPKKGLQETPEWRRRLLHGDVAYGEQRDLFSPAGLENIFRPPPEGSSPSKRPTRNFGESSVMPSSPPPYIFGCGNEVIEAKTLTKGENSEDEANNRPQPRIMKYNMVDDGCGSSEFSGNDLSQSGSFQQVMANFQGSQGCSFPSAAPSSLGSSVIRKADPVCGTGRIVSGQSDIRNEEFSPVYVSRHNTIGGKIDYTALDLPPAELQRRLNKIREDSPEQTTKDENGTSQIPPGDVTTEAEEYAHNGQFVNLRRGGYSEDGSFQKRMLSSSSAPALDESAMLQEESMQASTPKQLPNIRKTRVSNEYQDSRDPQDTPPIPGTPHQSPTKSGEKSISGSPLKLFGNYDTFTNQKLLRRLSQFEGDYDGNDEDNVPSTYGHESTHLKMNEGFVSALGPQKISQQSTTPQHSSRKVTSFGQGDLDSFQFSEDISYNSSESISQDDEDKENMTLPVLDPSTQNRFRFQLDHSPALKDDMFTKGQERYTATTSTTKQTISVRKTTRPSTRSSVISTKLSKSQIEDFQTPRKLDGDSEGKRLPRSPLKDPTPKRRRTLHKTEIVEEGINHEPPDFDSLKETHHQMQSVLGRKRKDARHDDDQQAANPKVLAMRQILRPRTPTPSQRSSVQNERGPLQEVDIEPEERARLLHEQKIAKIQAELDSNESLRASTALGISKRMFDESRKGSVTTQDFLDEAKKIMAGIRGKARSGLTSLEESESENDRNISTEVGTPDGELEDSYQESTKEPFSRPPSRDGKPVQRLPQKQEDPALLDHLRKYQEMSDIENVVASSVKSIAKARKAANTAKEIDRVTVKTISRMSSQLLGQECSTESDPPNIRISENPDLQRKRKHSTSSALAASSEDLHGAEFPSQGSDASSGQSTARSVPTGSSRGSDSRRVIAPHTVSHLIPEQLAGMVFDRERNIWIKRKAVSGESGGLNFLPSDETEDDPFGDIPDLSVDETGELHRLKVVVAKKKEEPRAEEYYNDEFQEAEKKASQRKQNAVLQAKNDKADAHQLPSLEPLRPTRLALSVTGHVPTAKLPRSSHTTQVVHHHNSTKTLKGEQVIEQSEREISILDDRIDPVCQRQRNVTISFSSPVSSVIQPSGYENAASFEREVNESTQSEDDENSHSAGSVIISKRGSALKPISTKTRASFRSASRRMSLGGHTFSARPVSRIDEQDENSFTRHDQDQRRRSISVIVTTPIPLKRTTDVIMATPRRAHEIGTLTLTPLSEFTMHQVDETLGLEVSYVERGQRYAIGSNTKRTLSLSIKELVEKISEVEPYEPFWEHMKLLDLKYKRLTNLHKLNEFCEHLEELDASHNQVSQLDGVPRSVRHLRITHNCLSDLAAWGHLSNLQYIDVSNNEIESLSGFRNLVHLRGLRADYNKIRNLDGINNLDGLLNLRLRGNLVELIDFKGTKLQRLTDLDLKDNRVYEVKNLHELRSLSNLNLEDNQISELPMTDSELLWALKYLKLGGNQLESIDVSQYPNLRLLYLDRNRLGLITGLLKTKHLDSLSMREQQDGAAIDMSFLSEAFEVRKLFLSGNLLTTFQPQADFLNLQYLELANCGLETLSPEFGQMVTNCRVLNLNFNALRDIKPLLGILRLKKLHLAGNRLSRLRTTTCVLSQFSGLSFTDLRNNPLTQGFYPPASETRMVILKGAEEEVEGPEPFTLGKANRTKDTKYVGRLDMETKMLRRVFEMLVLGGCPRLKTLDGLGVDRSVQDLKDKVWNDLVQAGVLREIGDNIVQGQQQKEEMCVKQKHQVEGPGALEKTILEERWHAEDSFT